MGAVMKPDWKKSDDYKFAVNTSLDRWAAEFLWRNSDFQKEVESALDDPGMQPQPIAWNEKPLGKVFVKWGARPMLPEWIKAGLSDSHMVFEKHPRYVPSYKVTIAGGLFTETALGKRYCVAPESQEKSVIEFDLSAPINPQIERAKKMLIAQQKQNNRGKVIIKKAIVSLYPWYLRTLDALAAGIELSEMIEVFSEQYSEAIGDDTMRNWKKEAERLRDGGYRELVTAPAASSGK